MRKMSKFAGLIDKYGNVEEDTERHLGRINWSGHIKAQGSFLGSAFISGYEHGFIAKDLKSDSNPRGSILQEAKNYTDAQIANINSAPARHGYRIFRKSNFYYLVYTNKDYPLAVGSSIDANDFETNSDYQELRENGKYPAGGYYKQLNRSATIVQINNNTFDLWGNVGTDHEFGVRDVSSRMQSDISITKIF